VLRASRDAGRYFHTVIRRRGDRHHENTHGAAYNRDATYAYAGAYNSNYNSAYQSFSNDCANFTGQLLKSGNFRGDLANAFYPYYLAWNVSQDQRNYGWNRSYWYGVSYGNAIRGDLAYYDYDSNGDINHSSMVTGNPGNTIYPLITQHTINRFNYSLKQQLTDEPTMTVGTFHVAMTN
jgi:hypothetical protein